MFFSVKSPMKLFGKKYIPCICYEATRPMEATIKHLEEEGKVAVYNEKVFFQNGKVLKSLAERKAEAKAKVLADKKALKDAKKKAKEEEILEETLEETEEDFANSDF